MNIPKLAWAYPSVSCEDPLFQKADHWDIPVEQDNIRSYSPCYSVLVVHETLFSSHHGYTLYHSSDTVLFRPIVHVTYHIQKNYFFFIRLHSKEILSAISGEFFSKIVNNWSKRYSTRPWDTSPEPLPKTVQDPKYSYARWGHERDEDGIFGINVHFLFLFFCPRFVDNLLRKYSPRGFGLQGRSRARRSNKVSTSLN